MENLEISARTVAEATKKALAQLNVGSDEVEIIVLSEGRSGILGLGAEDARISVKLLRPEKDNEVESVEVARTVLKNILDKMGVQAEIKIKPSQMTDDGEGNPTVLDIMGEDSGNLIGRHGQTIDSLQYLVRLIVSKQTKSKTPIMIDVQDYKQRHYEDLRSLALNVASQVKSRKTSIRLEPMSAFERRIIHMALANDTDVITESIGEGESRKVVVYPKLNK